MKRILAFLLAAALAAGLLAACGSNDGLAGSGEPQAQDTENTGGPENGESPLSGEIVVAHRTTGLQSYAQKFMAANPGTTVTVEVLGADYDVEVAARIAGGEAPDIFLPGSISSISPDAYAEYLLPIDDLPFTAEDILGYEHGRGADGNLYALPMRVSYSGMIYNKALFAEAGITEIPTTVEEFYDVCDQLLAAEISALIIDFSQDGTGSWYSWSDVSLRAGDARAQAKYVEQDLLFDDVMLASMDIVRDIVFEFITNQESTGSIQYNASNDPDYVYSAWGTRSGVPYDDPDHDYQFVWLSNNLTSFAQGEVAMTYSTSGTPSELVSLGAIEENIGMFPFPGAANVAAYPGEMLGISKDTENPELAKAFLAYMLENPYSDTLIPSNVHLEVSDPFVAELLSYGVEALASLSSDDTFTTIIDELEQELKQELKQELGYELGYKVLEQAFFEDYVGTRDDEKAQAMVTELNEKWAEIRQNYVE